MSSENNKMNVKDTASNVFHMLKEKSYLETCFFNKLNSMRDIVFSNIYNVIIQSTESNQLINGCLKPKSDYGNILSKQYFQIILEPQSTAIPSTEIILTISDDPTMFSAPHQKELEESTKNNYNYATIAAVVTIALLIPTGILSIPYLTEESLNKSTQISGLEQQLVISEFYLNSNEPQTALTGFEIVRQTEPANIESIFGVAQSLGEKPYYKELLRNYNSLLVIDQNYPDNQNPGKTILHALFYPDGTDGSALLIPRTNPGDVPSISLEPITKNIIPVIVYPTNSVYPAIVYSEKFDALPRIRTAESIDSDNIKNEIVVIPGQMTNQNAKFVLSDGIIPQEYHAGPDGPYVIYPYGISSTEDLPALVFPQKSFNPLIIIPENIASDSDTIEDVITYDQPENNISKGLSQSEISYTDIVFENGIDQSILESYDQNIPIRIFPDGPDSLPIEYPVGLAFTKIIELPPVSEKQFDPEMLAYLYGVVLNYYALEYDYDDSDRTIVMEPPWLIRIDNDELDKQLGDRLDEPSETPLIDLDIGFSYPSNPNIGTPYIAISDHNRSSWDSDSSSNYSDGNSANTNTDNNDLGNFVEFETELSKSIIVTGWSEDIYDNISINLIQGDPLIFALNGEEPCTIKMWPEQHDSFHWFFDLTVSDLDFRMDRTLCDGTYLMYVDFNSNGKMDNGYEMLWHPEFTVYDIMGKIDQIKDGHLNESDESLWQKIKIMDWNYQTYTTEELGVREFVYYNPEVFPDDDYGMGTYADWVGASENHFRIVAYKQHGIILDGKIIPSYGMTQAPMQDCTKIDYRYILGEQNLIQGNYEEALRYYTSVDQTCENSPFGISGMASIHHRLGNYEEALPLYLQTIERAGDNHDILFYYLTDTADVLYELGYVEYAKHIIEQSKEINSEHGYTDTVMKKILR